MLLIDDDDDGANAWIRRLRLLPPGEPSMASLEK
jgi:hypothetical protein